MSNLFKAMLRVVDWYVFLNHHNFGWVKNSRVIKSYSFPYFFYLAIKAAITGKVIRLIIFCASNIK